MKMNPFLQQLYTFLFLITPGILNLSDYFAFCPYSMMEKGEKKETGSSQEGAEITKLLLKVQTLI